MKIDGIKVDVDRSVGFGLVVATLEKPKNEEEAEKVKALFEKLQGPSGGTKLNEVFTYADTEMRRFPKDRSLVFTNDSWTYSVPLYNTIT